MHAVLTRAGHSGALGYSMHAQPHLELLAWTLWGAALTLPPLSLSLGFPVLPAVFDGRFHRVCACIYGPPCTESALSLLSSMHVRRACVLLQNNECVVQLLSLLLCLAGLLAKGLLPGARETCTVSCQSYVRCLVRAACTCTSRACRAPSADAEGRRTWLRADSVSLIYPAGMPHLVAKGAPAGACFIGRSICTDSPAKGGVACAPLS